MKRRTLRRTCKRGAWLALSLTLIQLLLSVEMPIFRFLDHEDEVVVTAWKRLVNVSATVPVSMPLRLVEPVQIRYRTDEPQGMPSGPDCIKQFRGDVIDP